ncbi:MFS transporter [Paenibacillus jamilae]|nr:MFS transporter [Paenibacillus jamilae]
MISKGGNMKFLQLQPNVKLRLVERFLTQMVTNSIFPFMGIYFSMEFGVKWAGILLAVNVFLSFLAGFYGGYMSDLYGRKKVLVYSEYVRLASVIAMVVGSSHFFYSTLLVCIGMLISSICAGLSNPAGSALIIDSSSSEERQYIYGLDYWLWNVSLLIGILLGGFLFEQFRMELFIALAVISFCSLLIVALFISESLSVTDPQIQKKSFWRSTAENYRVVLTNKGFIFFLLASLLDLSIELQSNNYTPIRLVQIIDHQTLFSVAGYSLKINGYNLFGILSMINTLSVILFGTLIAKLFKKTKDTKAVMAGILLYAAGYALIVIGKNPWFLLAVMLILSIGEVIYIPRKQALLADIMPSDKRGSYMAINSLTTRGAMMIGSLSVTFGAYVPSWIIGLEMFLLGVISVFLYIHVFALKRSSPAVQGMDNVVSVET